jgi:hypothetical protein
MTGPPNRKRRPGQEAASFEKPTPKQLSRNARRRASVTARLLLLGRAAGFGGPIPGKALTVTKAIGLDRGRLGRVLGLLGSDFDGEIVAAGRAANALVLGAGLTWPEVITERATAPGLQVWRPPPTTAEAIALCLRWPEILTGWEAQFLSSLSLQRRVSARQFEVLTGISAKVEIARASCGAAADLWPQ